MNYSQNGFIRDCVENEALSASKMPSSFYAFYKISSGFEKELRRDHSLNKSFYYRLSDSFTSPFILILTQQLENKEILSQITRHPLSAKMCSHFFPQRLHVPQSF